MIEREVKIRVPSHDALRPLLEQMGAVYSGREQEINRILDSADGTLYKNKQILRVRSTPDGVLTWKGPVAEQDSLGHKMREEIQLDIGRDDVDTLLTLLARLGFREALRYDKLRETWRWQGVEVALDTLVFGQFVEIEGEAAVIERAIHLLRLDDQPFEPRSYPELQRQSQQESLLSGG